MTTITISRQFGCGGAGIAKRVAAELGYDLLDRKLVDAVAARAGARPEEVETFSEADYGWATNMVYALLHALHGQTVSAESYRYIATELIREASAKGNVVILGRGGQAALGMRPGVLHVRVVAPLETRIARVAQREGIGQKEAERMIRDRDEVRRRFVETVTGRDWDDPLLYTLVLNTQLLSEEGAAAVVIAAARELQVPGQ